MVDFGRRARFLADLDQLVDRFDQLRPFVADMADVHAAAAPRLARQRDQLRRFGEIGRRIDQRGTDTHRPLVHRLPHQRPHPLRLLRRRIDIALAQFVHPDRGRADEAGDVGRDAFLLQPGQIFA